MAYLDLELGVGGPRVLKRERPRILTVVERSAVMVSRGDGLPSVRGPRRFDRIKAFVFGVQAPRRLADDRLEAVRRFAVVWRIQGDHMADVEVSRAIAAGLDPRALDAIRQIVAPWRNRSQSSHYVVPKLIALLTAALISTFWLTPVTGDVLISMMLIGVAIVTVVPLVFGTGPVR